MEDGKPLSNADFRKMLMTPRPGGPAPDLNAQAAGARKERRPRPRPPKPKPGGGDKDAEEIAGSSYRDRAAERRLGMGAGEDAAVPGGGTMGGFLGSATHAPGDFSSLSYEDSKYLGGDMDHTHLVKGLDYALLTKIRSDQASEEAAQVLGEVAEVENRGLGSSMSVPAPSGGPVFHTPLGRALHDYLFQKHQRPMVHVFPSERFLPRRMAFVFDMERSREAGEVPTTLLRAKEDCPKPQQSLQAALDASVLGRLAKIMAYTSLSGDTTTTKNLWNCVTTFTTFLHVSRIQVFFFFFFCVHLIYTYLLLSHLLFFVCVLVACRRWKEEKQEEKHSNRRTDMRYG